MRIFKFVITITFLFIVNSINAQPWLQNLKTENPTFKEVQDAFYEYWKDKPIEKGKGYKPFKRWEYYFSTRLLANGKLPESNITWENWKSYQNSHTEQLSRTNSTANWTASGPSSSNGGYHGLGRINCMAFHTTNPNIFWVGTPAGGLWKTINGGTTWTTNTDYFPVLGISDIAIDPTNPNTMYVATGDGDLGCLSSLTGGSNGDTKSIGVLKSIDGGSTWSYTGLNWSVTSSKLIRRLIINPTNPNILIAAASDSLYKTTDAGATWTGVQKGYFMDAEFKPNDASIVYAATFGANAQIYRSVNTGTTWSSVKTLPGVYRINLAVSANNSNFVDAVTVNAEEGLEGLWYSNNSGASFSRYLTGTTSNNMLHNSYNASGSGGQGTYDLAYAINPNNINDIWLGGVNTWNSTDGGFNWNIKTMWNGYNNIPEVHADKHFFAFHPLVPGTFFECNDGGLYKTTNGGTSWTDLTNTMQISQIYRIGVNQNFTGNVICGLQDNGTKEISSNSWYEQTGGDGMECIIDYTNGNIKYATYVQGLIYKTTTGTNWSEIVGNDSTGVDEPGEWVTPYIMHPTINTTLLVGKSQVYKTINGGTTWAQLGTITGAVGNIIALAYASSNTQVIYAATRTQIFKTSNGGNTWIMLNGVATTTVASPNTYLTVSPTNPDIIYTTQGGYLSADKVWVANTLTPATTTWQNVSGTLPNVPINCITYQKNTADAIYIGTDVGVFYKNNTMTDWVTYKTGLPNVVVTELEIAYNDNKIWAATFGRGLWSSNLYTSLPTTLLNFDAKISNKDVNLTWETTNEINTNNYEVEKSFDGNNWINIGIVIAKNITGTNSYSLTDKNPNYGINYYRLKMNDKDGKYTYSPTRTVNFTKGGLFVSVAPNPASSFTTITFNQPVKNVMISVVDAQGKKVMSEKIGNTTISNYQLNTAKLSAGIYTINFNVDDKVYNEKLVIVR